MYQQFSLAVDDEETMIDDSENDVEENEELRR